MRPMLGTIRSVKIGYEISFTRYFSVIPSPSSLHRHPRVVNLT